MNVSSVVSLEDAIQTHPCDEQHIPDAQVWPPLDPQVSSDPQLDCTVADDAGAATLVLATYATDVVLVLATYATTVALVLATYAAAVVDDAAE